MSDFDEEKEFCANTVKDFVDVIGGWEKLKTFNFWELYQEQNNELSITHLVDFDKRTPFTSEQYETYGTEKCSILKYDPDNSKIMNAIYYLLYKKHLPNLKFSEIGDCTIKNIKHKNLYRGDTINTYSWLFFSESLLNINYIPESVQEEVKKFQKEYLIIGNFYLLSNISDNKQTINKIRGMYRKNSLHDYFPLFLDELEKYFSTKHSDYFSEKLMENNKEYFEVIGKTNEKFLENNFFTFYNYELADDIKKKNYCYWNNKDFPDYKCFVNKYLKFAREIINSRAKEMVSELEKIVGEL